MTISFIVYSHTLTHTLAFFFLFTIYLCIWNLHCGIVSFLPVHFLKVSLVMVSQFLFFYDIFLSSFLKDSPVKYTVSKLTVSLSTLNILHPFLASSFDKENISSQCNYHSLCFFSLWLLLMSFWFLCSIFCLPCV